MNTFHVRVYQSKEILPKEQQLAWKLSKIATDKTPIDREVTEMIINRIIDNAAVAIAAINRNPVANARSQALSHPRNNGANIFGLANDKLFDAEWAAWANGTAVRELDMHDTFLAADYSHPADNIPPIIAVAQQCNVDGNNLIHGIATAYEVQISLVKAICLHKHKIDHIAHLGPSVAAGIGSLLNLDTDTIYQSIQQALHVCCTTRQSRKGEISSWKAYAPAHAGKLAVESVDRAMRGETSPSPIYEGEDSVIAYLLDGKNAEYYVPLINLGEEKRSILESYTKEHSAEYQSQALIDLAFKLKPKITNYDDIENIVIHTSHHTHYVIGTGSGDPQKFDPNASRETLDHSIMYIFAVALQDGKWHHVNSYTKDRANRPDTIKLWNKISTVEDPLWTNKYHDPDPNNKAFGGKVIITFKNASNLEDEISLANAHPFGAKPFKRSDYINKFSTLTEGLIGPNEKERFLSLVQRLPDLNYTEINQINVQIQLNKLINSTRDNRGIF